jgi:hypothetical protein
LPRLGVRSRKSSAEIAASAKQSFPHHWKISKAQNGSQFAHGFQISVYIEQGVTRHRKYKRLKLGGGQAYDRSSD